MDINELYYSIQSLNADTEIDEERRSVRLSIYQSLLYKADGENKLRKLIASILEEGKRLEKLTNYHFLINEDLEKTRILVKGFILESRFITELHSRGVEDFSFSDLEKYLQQYIVSTKDTIDDVATAIRLYPKLLEYKDMYITVYDNIVKYLSEVFGSEMLKNSGDVRLKYQRIMERIGRMSDRELFDDKTKEMLELLINDLFSFYVNSDILIPIETQIDVSGTKELIA